MKQYVAFEKQEFVEWSRRLRAEVSWMLKEQIMRDNNWTQDQAIDAAFWKLMTETGIDCVRAKEHPSK